MSLLPVFVEILIRTGIDELWAKTQEPAAHQRWDRRFSSIEYLPRTAGEPQRFLYQTRIGAGLAIRGTGESVGSMEADGVRVSVLRFASDDRCSLIVSGGGYWKYIPQDGHVRFLTRYTYESRFGLVGRLVDQWCFRPFLGWATAISFDCLRLWIERGIPPESSWLRLHLHVVSRVAIAVVWLWHGLVPKLLFPHDEQALITAAGMSTAVAATLVTGIGIAELGMAAALLVSCRTWPLWSTLVSMLPSAIAACIAQPHLITAPFTPLTLGLALATLAIIGLMTHADLPSATRCRRAPSSPSEPPTGIP